jgi:hypothetical protein
LIENEIRSAMTVFDERREELEKHEFMMGATRGRLAVSLDMLTDALILIGQHGVYCTSGRNPSKPALDLETVLSERNGVKMSAKMRAKQHVFARKMASSYG